jgi:hypothetical protein
MQIAFFMNINIMRFPFIQNKIILLNNYYCRINSSFTRAPIHTVTLAHMKMDLVFMAVAVLDEFRVGFADAHGLRPLLVDATDAATDFMPAVVLIVEKSGLVLSSVRRRFHDDLIVHMVEVVLFAEVANMLDVFQCLVELQDLETNTQ